MFPWAYYTSSSTAALLEAGFEAGDDDHKPAWDTEQLGASRNRPVEPRGGVVEVRGTYWLRPHLLCPRLVEVKTA